MYPHGSRPDAIVRDLLDESQAALARTLTNAQGYAHLFTDASVAARSAADAQDLLAAIKQLHVLAQQAIELVSLPPTSRQATCLAESAVSECRDMIARILGASVRLEVDPMPQVHVAVSPGTLRQLLMITALFARQVLVAGGTLRLAATARGDDALCLSASCEGRASVTADTIETWIAEDHAWGYGLAAARESCAVIGARIEARPPAGIDLVLPTVPDEASSSTHQAAGAPEQGEAQQGGTADARHILVVDDEQLIRRLTVRALARAGYELIEAGEGEEALRKTESVSLIAIVTDLNLQRGMSGIELIERLRQRQPGLPAVLTTGLADVRAGESLPSNAVLLRKPYTGPTVCAVLADAIAISEAP